MVLHSNFQFLYYGLVNINSLSTKELIRKMHSSHYSLERS